MLNVHPSLLPRWRGAARSSARSWPATPRPACAIMRLTAGLDAGPVCLRGAEPIGPRTRTGRSRRACRSSARGCCCARSTSAPPFVEQPEDGVTYAERITAEDRTLDPEAPPAVNERIVRALHPHIGARVAARRRLVARRPARAVREPALPASCAPTASRLLLGGLELLEVQPPGGKPMDAAAYLRGRGL